MSTVVDPKVPSPPASADAPDPRIGTELQGRYRILSKIAEGAMGVVYRGERMQLARPVAVKFLHPWIAAQKTFRSRFENEARAMSRLAHPHCVSVIDFGVEGSPYLVMDFVTGRTLRDATYGQGPQPPTRVLHIARQLLAGLGHAHSQGIVHRDLKPENLILTDEEGLDDHLRILDFGLAKLRDGPAMTAGMAVGTPSYMSPEQTGAAGVVDARSDLYAVGVLLFELLAGRKPFESAKIGELILMHRETPPPALRGLTPAPGISPALEAVILKALAKSQDDRFQSAAELAAALEATPEATSGARSAARSEAKSDATSDGQPAPEGPGAALPARAVGLPPPPSGRPPQSPRSEATIVDTATAVMRRLDLAAPPDPGGEAAAALAGAAPAALDETAGATNDTRVDLAVPATPAPAAATSRPASSVVSIDRRYFAVGAGLVGCVLLAIVLGLFRHRASESAPAVVTPSGAAPGAAVGVAPGPPVPPAGVGPAPGAPGPGPGAPAPGVSGVGSSAAPAAAGAVAGPSARVDEARRLRHNGEWEQALAVLNRAHREEPANADVDYLLADIYLEHHRPLEGLAAAQSAVRKNPALRGDGDLVNAAIGSLANDRTYDRSETFLRGLGPAATPFIKEAARRDPSAKVRQRAAEILQGAGGGRSAFGSKSRSSSSLFSR
jgi:serine/threonine-protein kinase